MKVLCKISISSLEKLAFAYNLVRNKFIKRSNVLFLHNSYYHFYYLAKALRKRGWDALTVSYEDPVAGANTNYFHGEDLNLYDADPEIFQRNTAWLYQNAMKRFNMLHFAGDGLMSFIPKNWNLEEPPDITVWKQAGKLLGYSISGCKSCTSQTSFAAWPKLDAEQSSLRQLPLAG